MRWLLALAVAVLAACGGGGSAAVPAPMVRMMVQNGTAVVPGFNASANFPRDDTPIAQAVAEQAQAPGDVILIMAPFRDTAFAHLDQWLGEAKKYPNIKWVYVFDELCWYGQLGTGCAHQQEVVDAARHVHQAGYKSVIAMDVGVIHDASWKALDINAFDVILVVDYPDVYILDQDVHGCSVASNPLTNFLACSIQELRRRGFAGEIGLVYQGFGLALDGTDLSARLVARLHDDLVLQRQTVADAPGLGVTWLVNFGFFPFDGLTWPLYPGKGSPIEPLVSGL